MTWSPLYTEDRFHKRREQRDKLQVQIEEMQQTMERLDKKIARYEQGHGADGKRTQTVKKEAGAAARLPLLWPKIFTKRKLFFDRRVWYTYAEKTESEKHCMEFAQLVTRRRSVRRIACIRYDAAFGCFTVGAQHNFAKPLIPQNQHCCYRYYFKDKNLC